jgi:hypothetical protein
MSEKYPELNKEKSLELEDIYRVAPKAGYENGPLKLQRDEFGLLKNIDYKFTQEGWVSWREMIDSKFLYPNKDWFEVRKQEVPSSIEGLEDNQLLIMLGGIKELARLRGFNCVRYTLENISDGHVSACCVINWMDNYENPEGCIFSSTANATLENTNGFGGKFLETIAENRSFVRAVRNFLNIHIVGADEIDKSKDKVVEMENTESSPSIIPHVALEKQAVHAGFSSYEDFRQKFLNPLIANKTYAPNTKPTSPWTCYADIPPVECRRITPLLKKK